MKVLVVGQGGREHALVKALKNSPSVIEVHCFPGADGMKPEAIVYGGSTADFQSVLSVVKNQNIELVVIGPEVELALGLADFLREHQVLVFGPSKQAAQLEGSKIFAKEFMVAAGIPTAKAMVVDSVAATLAAAVNFKPPYVIKADGLAAGKGVAICETVEDLRQAAVSYFETKIFGVAGERALLEQFEAGWELSFLVLTNGQGYEVLPLSQDHKRLQDGGRGPNTGGMGTIAPLTLRSDLEKTIHEKILRPSVRELAQAKLFYRGVLYVGLMITPYGPLVIEYNCRFGDPETQVIMPLLDGDWGHVFLKIAKGELPNLTWKRRYCACVVLAAAGYPDKPVKDAIIDGDLNFSSEHSYFLHAGTKLKGNNQWVTNGGRVLNAIGVGDSLNEALVYAYMQSEKVFWPGVQLRRDIGKSINT